MESGTFRGGRWLRVVWVRKDRKRVVTAVPITGYGVEIPWMYAEIHPQEEVWGGQVISRVVMT